MKRKQILLLGVAGVGLLAAIRAFYFRGYDRTAMLQYDVREEVSSKEQADADRLRAEVFNNLGKLRRNHGIIHENISNSVEAVLLDGTKDLARVAKLIRLAGFKSLIFIENPTEEDCTLLFNSSTNLESGFLFDLQLHIGVCTIQKGSAREISKITSELHLNAP